MHSRMCMCMHSAYGMCVSVRALKCAFKHMPSEPRKDAYANDCVCARVCTESNIQSITNTCPHLRTRGLHLT